MSIEAMKQTFDFLHDLWDMKQTIRSDRHKKVMWELDRAIGKAEKREWVGLTDEEIREIDDTCCYSLFSFTRAIEAKLREKNAYGWQSVENPTEYLDELRGGKDEGTNKDLCDND